MITRKMAWCIAALAIGLLCYSGAASAQHDLLWAKRAGGESTDKGNSISAHTDGSSVVTGDFQGTATFGSSVLTSAGGSDIFVAKYAADGSLLWVKQAGGVDNDNGLGISAHADGTSAGTSVVTGHFQGTATFGPGEANETVLDSAGVSDIFVAKYAADGSLLWAKKAGGVDGDVGSDIGKGISAHTDGTSVVTGTFNDTATFGPGEANETVLAPGGLDNIFVAKYAADGSLLWAKCAGGGSYDRGISISTHTDGTSVVTGEFMYTAYFGPGEENETVLVSGGGWDIFVAKYAADGSLLWAKKAGGVGADEVAHSISAHTDGTSVVTGEFRHLPMTFGPGEANETVLAAVGEVDMFVAKYAADGSLLWAKQAVGEHMDYISGRSISAHADGTSVVTGEFGGTAIFGPGEANETLLWNGCIFVAKYAADGSLLWVTEVVNDDGWVLSYGISAHDNGTSVVTGEFLFTSTFGPGEENETVLDSASIDIFVAKYEGVLQSTPTPTATPTSTPTTTPTSTPTTTPTSTPTPTPTSTPTPTPTLDPRYRVMRINFQPAALPVPPEFMTDSGQALGAVGEYEYGWR